MLLHDSRRAARVVGDGSWSRWTSRTARAGTRGAGARAAPCSTARCACAAPARTSSRRRSPRCTARTEVDWPQIAALYRRLALHGALARGRGQPRGGAGMAGSPRRRALLALLDARRRSTLPAAARGPRRAAAPQRRGAEAAVAAYARAIALSANAVERAELERRRVFYGTALALPFVKQWGKMPASVPGRQPDDRGHAVGCLRDRVQAQRHRDRPPGRRRRCLARAARGRGRRVRPDNLDSGVCHQAFLADPDGNLLILHHRYAPARLALITESGAEACYLRHEGGRHHVGLPPARSTGGLRRRRARSRSAAASGVRCSRSCC